VSTFAQQLARNDTFIIMTETILFVAELVSLNCMVKEALVVDLLYTRPVS